MRYALSPCLLSIVLHISKTRVEKKNKFTLFLGDTILHVENTNHALCSTLYWKRDAPVLNDKALRLAECKVSNKNVLFLCAPIEGCKHKMKRAPLTSNN